MIAVHCGAGYHSQALEAAYKRDLGAACRAGAAALAGGSDALAAVTAAIKVLEDSPHGNAGHGSNLSFNGLVECDASVMAGDGAFGAVAAAPGLKNPVEAAAALASEGRLPLSHGRVRPMVLAGDQAREWALSRGLEAAASSADAASWHQTDRSQRQWRKYRRMVDDSGGGGGSAAVAAAPAAPPESAAAEGAQQVEVPARQQQQQQPQQRQRNQHAAQREDDAGQGQPGGKRRRVDSAAERDASPLQGEPSEPGASCFYDTVGCVVLAPDGSVAAGVSSGGILLKTEGRVGEAAAFGAGCWAQAAAPAGAGSPQPAQPPPQHGAAGRQQAAAAALPALACSVTGVGEAVMRHLLARECCREAAAAAEAAALVAPPASSAAADGSETEDGEAAAPSEPPVAHVAAALLQRTVLRGPPPHDCGVLCLKAQPIEEEAHGARQLLQNGGARSAAECSRRQPVRYAVEVSVAHCAQSMAFGHLACAQSGGGTASPAGGSGSAASRAAVPAMFVLRRQAGCSGRPAPVVQTYTHGTTLLL